MRLDLTEEQRADYTNMIDAVLKALKSLGVEDGTVFENTGIEDGEEYKIFIKKVDLKGGGCTCLSEDEWEWNHEIDQLQCNECKAIIPTFNPYDN